jgi:hypothetical protein
LDWLVPLLATGLTPIVRVGAIGAGAAVTVKRDEADETIVAAPVNSLENAEVPVATTTLPDKQPVGGHESVMVYT